ncbi:AP2 domain transcription factor AP2IX-7, putative [Babesia ovis]|uniref:AP2 domain transcription factor AP2IX-7, putative n=1 Tax=Babesia ovis TaxID=5869 RepID=A0A9W5WV64_BABOV|nr:AP2 domain transcription factor AP2IX-7, putative [Babesia ovis]
MDDGKLPMTPGGSNPGLVHPSGSPYVYDGSYMCQITSPVSSRSGELGMQMPGFVHTSPNMMKSGERSFDNLSLHPGLRVQLPSNEQLPSPLAMGMDEMQARQRMMSPEADIAVPPKSRRGMGQMRYPTPPVYNASYAPSVMNFNMAGHHRMADIPMPSMFRFPPPKDAVSHVFAQLDNEVGPLATSGGLPLITTPHALGGHLKFSSAFTSDFNQTVEKYQRQLRIRPESIEDTMDYNGGMIYDKGPFSQGGRWLVFWYCNGRMWRKSFLVHMYGHDGAKELAEQFWFSKMRALQLYKATRNIHINLDGEVKRGTIESHKLQRQKRPQPRSIITNGDTTSILENSQLQDDPEVFWDADTNSWCFDFLDTSTNTMTVKRIPVVNEAVSQDVKLEASRQRIEHWRSLLKDYSESEYCGHSYEKSRTCWRVSHWIPSKGINRNRYFNISKYGYIEAKEISRRYRLLVHDLGGEEPDIFPVDSLPTPEFFENPVTKFYHRILNSLRTKQ